MFACLLNITTFTKKDNSKKDDINHKIVTQACEGFAPLPVRAYHWFRSIGPRSKYFLQIFCLTVSGMNEAS